MRNPLFLFLCALAASVYGNLREDIINGRTAMKGVNLGGWLVAEHWMTSSSPAWRDVPDDIANHGEYSAMKHLGHGKGDSQFDEHRRTYITEQDFKDISSAHLNTVRIPVGYWIVGFDNHGGGDSDGWKVYAPGAIKYLDKAIREWAPKHNLVVLISMHAAKGSQNGNDNSSPEDPGHAYWSQYKENVDNTLDVVEWLAKRYKNEAGFLGIGMLNEPRWDEDENVLKQYYYDAYGRIRNNVGSDCLLTTQPLLNQQGPHDSDWFHFMPPPNFQGVRHEWHKYQVWGFEASKQWNAEGIINYVNGDLKNSINAWSGNWMYIGEWSCATDGSVPMNDDQLRRYAQAQLNTFKDAHGGWTFWTWKYYNDAGGKNGWSLRALINSGYIHL